ncbi:hypothetical protein TNCV_393251 [Trichonephila clavipes]|nr:hypothetical protein TNCV_393251 [Trichonephila clavipes]
MITQTDTHNNLLLLIKVLELSSQYADKLKDTNIIYFYENEMQPPKLAIEKSCRSATSNSSYATVIEELIERCQYCPVIFFPYIFDCTYILSGSDVHLKSAVVLAPGVNLLDGRKSNRPRG